MHGRALLLSRVLLTGALAWILTGCEPPRIKSLESYTSATQPNPPRDFKKAPLDPYSYGGIAGATGGIDPRTSYGAMSGRRDIGLDPLYQPSKTVATPSQDDSPEYLWPDAKKQPKTPQHLASAYLDKEGHLVAPQGTLVENPPRAGEVAPHAASEEGEASHE